MGTMVCLFCWRSRSTVLPQHLHTTVSRFQAHDAKRDEKWACMDLNTMSGKVPPWQRYTVHGIWYTCTSLCIMCAHAPSLLMCLHPYIFGVHVGVLRSHQGVTTVHPFMSFQHSRRTSKKWRTYCMASCCLYPTVIYGSRTLITSGRRKERCGVCICIAVAP